LSIIILKYATYNEPELKEDKEYGYQNKRVKPGDFTQVGKESKGRKVLYSLRPLAF